MVVVVVYLGFANPIIGMGVVFVMALVSIAAIATLVSAVRGGYRSRSGAHVHLSATARVLRGLMGAFVMWLIIDLARGIWLRLSR